MLKTGVNLKYCKLVERLFMKCQELQTENERFVFRLLKTKKMIRRRLKDVAILKARLDRHKDDWRHVPMVVPHKIRKTEHLKRGPKPKPKSKKDEKTNKISKKKTILQNTNQINNNNSTQS